MSVNTIQDFATVAANEEQEEFEDRRENRDLDVHTFITDMVSDYFGDDFLTGESTEFSTEVDGVISRLIAVLDAEEKRRAARM